MSTIVKFFKLLTGAILSKIHTVHSTVHPTPTLHSKKCDNIATSIEIFLDGPFTS